MTGAKVSSATHCPGLRAYDQRCHRCTAELCGHRHARRDPTFQSYFWISGPKGYIANSEGSDIWGNTDGCSFMYETKTGDFDVVVMQKNITFTSTWAKGGLMVRESVDPASRNWNVVNTPLASVGGSGGVECNARWEYLGASSGWDSGTRPAPAYPPPGSA